MSDNIHTRESGLINVRECRRDNQKRTIQITRQHMSYKTEKTNLKNNIQYAWDNTMRKQIQNM